MIDFKDKLEQKKRVRSYIKLLLMCNNVCGEYDIVKDIPAEDLRLLIKADKNERK